MQNSHIIDAHNNKRKWASFISNVTIPPLIAVLIFGSLTILCYADPICGGNVYTHALCSNCTSKHVAELENEGEC